MPGTFVNGVDRSGSGGGSNPSSGYPIFWLLYPFISLSFSFTCARLTWVYRTVVWMAGVPFYENDKQASPTSVKFSPSKRSGFGDNPEIRIILAPHAMIEAKPDVFNHNVETIPRLYKRVRPQAIFERSYNELLTPGVVFCSPLKEASNVFKCSYVL